MAKVKTMHKLTISNEDVETLVEVHEFLEKGTPIVRHALVGQDLFNLVSSLLTRWDEAEFARCEAMRLALGGRRATPSEVRELMAKSPGLGMTEAKAKIEGRRS